MYFHFRRVYKGLLKLLSAKKEHDNAKKLRKTREVSKLVTHIALGSEAKIQGNQAMVVIKHMHFILAIISQHVQFPMKAKKLLRRYLGSIYKLGRCGRHPTYF